jgi:hypothetical protein
MTKRRIVQGNLVAIDSPALTLPTAQVGVLAQTIAANVDSNALYWAMMDVVKAFEEKRSAG